VSRKNSSEALWPQSQSRCGMTNFYFLAVASEWTDSYRRLSRRVERLVAFELRRQGSPRCISARNPRLSVDIKLPSFSGNRKRDVLFFTQEISTLLSAGVPVNRARFASPPNCFRHSVSGRPSSPRIVAAPSTATAPRRHPAAFAANSAGVPARDGTAARSLQQTKPHPGAAEQSLLLPALLIYGMG